MQQRQIGMLSSGAWSFAPANWQLRARSSAKKKQAAAWLIGLGAESHSDAPSSLQGVRWRYAEASLSLLSSVAYGVSSTICPYTDDVTLLHYRRRGAQGGRRSRQDLSARQAFSYVFRSER